MKAAAAFLLLAAAAPASAQTPRFSMTLREAEAAAVRRSPAAAAAAGDAAAAAARAASARADWLPRLTLEGSYRYQESVPVVALAPGAPAKPFGDHRQTSLGPSLSWTLWDEGALRRQWKALEARAASQRALARLSRRQTLLAVRLAYFQLQLAREQLALLFDSSGLADAEYADIAARQKAGAASRLDALAAHQEALGRRRDYLDAQAALGAAFSELTALTGGAQGLETVRATDARRPVPLAGLPPATLLLSVDDLAVSTAALGAAAATPLDPGHPRLAAYEAIADAARLSARAAGAAARPRVQLSARSSYDYPQVPLLQSVWQNTVGLSASMPLFESGRSKSVAEEQLRLAEAAEARRAEAADGLARDRAQALERLGALESQLPLIETSVAETDEIARLTYSSYKLGHASFLEVQSANLRALEAKTARARAGAQALIQLAVLAGLSPEEAP